MTHPLVDLLVASQGWRRTTNDGKRASSDGPRAGVLDLRRAETPSVHPPSARRYFKGALRIEAGWAGLDDRYSWLPPPSRKPNKGKSRETRPASRGTGSSAGNAAYATPCQLVILCDTPERQAIADALDRWDVVDLICNSSDYDAEAFWREADEQKLLEDAPRTPTYLLFEPSPIARTVVHLWEEHLEVQHSPVCASTILDLGCGAGRDLAWIVRYGQDEEASRPNQSSMSWLATGLDNLSSTIRRVGLLVDELALGHSDTTKSRWEAIVHAKVLSDGAIEALGVTGALFDGRQEETEQQIRTFAKDHLPHSTYDVLLLVRFLPLSLLHHLHTLTHTGSMVALSHFTTVDVSRDTGIGATSELKSDFMPGKDKRLERWQLDEFLDHWQTATSTPWSILHHSISGSEDGRPLRHVVFQRH